MLWTGRKVEIIAPIISPIGMPSLSAAHHDPCFRFQRGGFRTWPGLRRLLMAVQRLTEGGLSVDEAFGEAYYVQLQISRTAVEDIAAGAEAAEDGRDPRDGSFAAFTQCAGQITGASVLECRDWPGVAHLLFSAPDLLRPVACPLVDQFEALRVLRCMAQRFPSLVAEGCVRPDAQLLSEARAGLRDPSVSPQDEFVHSLTLVALEHATDAPDAGGDAGVPAGTRGKGSRPLLEEKKRPKKVCVPKSASNFRPL